MSEMIGHPSLVARQFGPRAAAYVASAVHARGADLDEIAAAVRDAGGGDVLDLGCGGGHAGFAVAPFCASVTACDLSPDMLAAVAAEAQRRGLHTIVTQEASAERLPFRDGRFDAVVSRFSAHHWTGWGAGIAEARRVLKTSGVAVFADAVTPEDPLLDTALQAIELLRDPSHVRNRSVAEWRERIEASGFAVTGITTGRLRLDFASWVARIDTPPIHRAAIRSLQGLVAEPVARHFAIEPDGSFTLDTMVLQARAV